MAELVWSGAEAITTNCGFLSMFRKEIAAHINVFAATSALIQVPWVQRTLPPGNQAGVIYRIRSSLTPADLLASGAPIDMPFVGTEDGEEFFRVLVLGEKQNMDVDGASCNVLDSGRRLVAAHPSVGAIVLECTNMPPMRTLWEMCPGYPSTICIVDHLVAFPHTAAEFSKNRRKSRLDAVPATVVRRQTGLLFQGPQSSKQDRGRPVFYLGFICPNRVLKS